MRMLKYQLSRRKYKDCKNKIKIINMIKLQKNTRRNRNWLIHQKNKYKTQEDKKKLLKARKLNQNMH